MVENGITFLTITLGTIAFGSLTMGYLSCGMNLLEWVVMAVATIILFFPDVVHTVAHLDLPGFAVDALGIGLWAVVFLLQKARIRKNPALTLPRHERIKLQTT